MSSLILLPDGVGSRKRKPNQSPEQRPRGQSRVLFPAPGCLVLEDLTRGYHGLFAYCPKGPYAVRTGWRRTKAPQRPPEDCAQARLLGEVG
jgi:hypothetical protein